MKYFLIDSGHQKKFEQFGPISIVRPCGQALWKPQNPDWKPDISFTRDEQKGWRGKVDESWVIEHEGIRFKLVPTDFGHLGIFPEHAFLWNFAAEAIRPGAQVLNLFAYSGGATMALAKAGAQVCHVDASQGMVKWARENAALNGLDNHPIRWIVDDAMKFLQREIRRGKRYDGILMDPPSFGRGAKGEVFKIERDLTLLLQLCKQLLSDDPLFFICSNHTNTITPIVLKHLVEEILENEMEVGELCIPAKTGRDLPTGSYARWKI